MSKPRKPHIVIFNPDEYRSDVMGHMGNPAASTPSFDRLVRDGAVSFRNAFCQHPICTPSRCSFMSGWYPHVRGHRTGYHMMAPDEPVLLKTLKRDGYFVWWGGKNDLVPAENGFDDYCHIKYRPARKPRPETDLHTHDAWRGPADEDNYYSFLAGRLKKAVDEESYYDRDWADVLGAVAFIRDAPTDRPLCIYLPLLYPHPPYGVEDPWYSLIDRRRLPPRLPGPPDWSGKPSVLRGTLERQRLRSWTEQRWTELRATYYGMCSRVDHQFGMIVEALKAAGIYDDTAIFVLSDHGDFAGDYGLVEKQENTFEDCLTRVPFIVKPPARVDVQPGVRDQLVELVDFAATVFDLAGIQPDYTHFGRSLMPIVAGHDVEHRDAVFCEGGQLREESGYRVRAGLTTGTDARGLYWPRIGLMDRSPEQTKAVMCRTRRHKYVRRLYEQDELYDLAVDPGEQTNLIADPTMAGVVSALQERLLTHYLETCDVVPHTLNKRE